MMTGHYIDKDLYGRGFDSIFGNEDQEKHVRSSVMTFRDMGDPIEFIDTDTSGRSIPLDFEEEVGKPRKITWKRTRTIGANSRLKRFAKKTKAFVKNFSGKRKRQKDFDEHDQSNNKDEVDNRNAPGKSTDDDAQNGSAESQPIVLYDVEQELSPGETTLNVSNFMGDNLYQHENLTQDGEGEPHAEQDISQDSSPQVGHVFSDVIRSEEECSTGRSTPRGISPADPVAAGSREVKATHAACCCEVVTSDRENSPESQCVDKTGSPSLVAAMGQDIKTSDECMEDIVCTRVSEGSQDVHDTFKPSQRAKMENINSLPEPTLQNVMNETTTSVEKTSLTLRAILKIAKLCSHITDFGTMLVVGSKNILTTVMKLIKAILQETSRMLGNIPLMQYNRRTGPRRMWFERFVLLGLRFTILRMMVTAQLIGEEVGGWLYRLFLSRIVRWMMLLVSVTDEESERR